MPEQIRNISSEEDAVSLIKEALSGLYDNEIIELNFNNWPNLELNIEGDRYNGTLPTQLMKALIELQNNLNRVYAEIIYGKNARFLALDEKISLELVFYVRDGSTNIGADLSDFFTELAKNAVDKMTGKQIIALVLGFSVIYQGASLFSSYLDSNEKIIAEKNRHELERDMIKQYPKLLEMQQETISAFTNILKSVPDAKKVKLNNKSISKSQIEMITKQDRQSSEIKRIDGEFLISSFKIKPESYRLEIVRKSDGKSVITDLQKGHLSINEMDYLMKSFASESPLYLDVVGRIKGDSMSSASIIGVKHEGNLITSEIIKAKFQ